MMRLHTLIVPAGALLALSVAAPAPAQEAAAQFRFETQRVDDYAARRAASVASTMGFSAWPRTPELYAAPAVSRTLLREPDAVAGEVRACTTVRFNEEPWPQCTWSWRPAPGGRKESSADWLDLQITVAPSARAAQEHLIASVTDNMLPTELLVTRFQSAERPPGLGDVAFVVRSRAGDDVTLTFLRANVVFRVRGHGSLAGEVLPLAARLDGQLGDQSPVSLDELRAWSSAQGERQ